MDDEKKKVKQAIALEYDPSDEAPRVVASGKGILADKIIEKARESSVPIHRDDKLADTLSRLDIGDSGICRCGRSSYGKRECSRWGKT